MNNEKLHKVRDKKRTSWIYETFSVINPLTGKSLKCEAAIERDFVLTKIFDPDILYIETNLSSFYSALLDRRYTRDVLTYSRSEGVDNWDCKPAGAMDAPKTNKKFTLLGEEIGYTGVKFQVVCGDQIRKGYLIPNLQRFYIYLQMPKPDDFKIKKITHFLESNLQVTLGELRVAMAKYAIDMRTIWYCFSRMIIRTDLEKYITNKSILWSARDAI